MEAARSPPSHAGWQKENREDTSVLEQGAIIETKMELRTLVKQASQQSRNLISTVVVTHQGASSAQGPWAIQLAIYLNALSSLKKES